MPRPAGEGLRSADGVACWPIWSAPTGPNHRPIAADSPQAEAVKVLARGRQNLIWACNRHIKALRSALHEYYPAALVAFDDLHDRDALAVLSRAPDPAAGAALTLAAIRSALRRGGRQRNIDARARQIHAALHTGQLTAPGPVAADSRPGNPARMGF